MFYSIVRFLQGKKTFLIGISAIIYGVYSKDSHIIVIGLGLIGIRDGMSTTLAQLIQTLETQKSLLQDQKTN